MNNSMNNDEWAKVGLQIEAGIIEDGQDDPETRQWRTLARVELVGTAWVGFAIPAFSVHETKLIKWSDIPQEMHQHIEIDQRFFVRANIGAENIDDLVITSWEFRG